MENVNEQSVNLDASQFLTSPWATAETKVERVAVDLLCPSSLTKILRDRGLLAHFTISYFDCTSWGSRMARALSRVLPFEVKMLDYSFIEVQDPDGGLSAIRVSALEVRDMSQEIVERYFRGHPMVERLVSHFDLERLLLYLGKGISDELIPRQMQVKVVSWFRRRTSAKPFPLYTVRCPWMSEMTEYAEACDVGLVWYRRCPSIHWNLTRIPSVCYRAWKALCRRLRLPEKMAVGESFVSRPTGKTIAVHYSGAGLTQDLSHNSDLFWLPSSGIDSSRVLLYFDRGDDPLDAQRVVDLRSQGLRCVALNRRATGHAEVPAYVSDRSQRRRFKLSVRVIKSVIKSLSETSEHLGWITLQFLEFARQYAYWYAFFEDQNVGVHVNFNDWYGERVASDQALHDLGGISISYQRSEESLIWLRASAVHVHFGFAPKKALDEARAGSHILQFVSAGYVHDHAFHLVGDRSRRLRQRIVEAGAGFVVTYFDENSSGDKRVNVSNQFAEVNYRFLLKRMLEDSTLGVILKPKKPSTLRARLSEDVQDLLDRAIATGRCVLMDEGVVTTPQLPCEPALASDLCIGLLFGATATLEGQLAGTPGILVDRERVTYHPLREQGLGRFVFDDWPSLWSALSSYRRDPDSVPGLGDWGTVLDELDTFRDGWAADRMGSYIGDLVTGMDKDGSRASGMSLAERNYRALWGDDKVLRIADGTVWSAPEPDRTLENVAEYV